MCYRRRTLYEQCRCYDEKITRICVKAWAGGICNHTRDRTTTTVPGNCQNHRGGQAGQAGQEGQVGQTRQAGQVGQTGQTGQTGQSGQAGQTVRLVRLVIDRQQLAGTERKIFFPSEKYGF